MPFQERDRHRGASVAVGNSPGPISSMFQVAPAACGKAEGVAVVPLDYPLEASWENLPDRHAVKEGPVFSMPFQERDRHRGASVAVGNSPGPISWMFQVAPAARRKAEGVAVVPMDYPLEEGPSEGPIFSVPRNQRDRQRGASVAVAVGNSPGPISPMFQVTPAASATELRPSESPQNDLLWTLSSRTIATPLQASAVSHRGRIRGFQLLARLAGETSPLLLFLHKEEFLSGRRSTWRPKNKKSKEYVHTKVHTLRSARLCYLSHVSR